MKNSPLYEKFKFSTQAEINAEFNLACRNGNLETVIFLLTSTDLKIHADIHADGDNGFQWVKDSITKIL